jgi:ubiquinone/menaquinone biosynthesis C-methylase UbiE
MEPIKTKKTHRKGNSGKLTRLDINKERYKSEKKAGLPNSTKTLAGRRSATYQQTKSTQNTAHPFPKGNVKKNSLLPTAHSLQPKESTSWGGVASWYDKHLEGSDTYHTKVILPALMRIVGDIKGKDVLDLACGQGFFSRALLEKGAKVTGIDIGKELIASAESVQKGQMNKVHYFVTGADDLFMLKDKSMDIIVCVLALQNIENIAGTMSEVARVLRKGGKFIFVLNHPAFRNPQASSWGYHEAEKIQYRRIDSYLSESKVKIDMTPGNAKEKKFTVSFHRPLQLWSKLLHKNNLAITRMEEWESHKVSEKGPRQEAENRSRKEIPLFLAIESVLLY